MWALNTGIVACWRCSLVACDHSASVRERHTLTAADARVTIPEIPVVPHRNGEAAVVVDRAPVALEPGICTVRDSAPPSTLMMSSGRAKLADDCGAPARRRRLRSISMRFAKGPTQPFPARPLRTAEPDQGRTSLASTAATPFSLPDAPSAPDLRIGETRSAAIKAAAALFSPGALPAVMVPSGRNCGFQSSERLDRGIRSRRLIDQSSPSPCGPSLRRQGFVRRPASRAATKCCCERAAKAS